MMRNQVNYLSTVQSDMIHVSDFLQSSLFPLNLFLVHHFNRTINSCYKVVQVSLFLSIISMVLFGVSQACEDFFLGVLSLVLDLSFKLLGSTVDATCTHILQQVLRTIRSALSKFNIRRHTTTYAVCPKCNCIYKPINMTDSHFTYPP